MNKTILAILMAALLVPATSFAAYGERSGPGKRVMFHMDRMATELELTDEQREQFQAIVKEQREKHRVVHQETRSRLNAILDDEQRAKMEALQAERKQRWQERRQQHKNKKSDDS